MLLPLALCFGEETGGSSGKMPLRDHDSGLLALVGHNFYQTDRLQDVRPDDRLYIKTFDAECGVLNSAEDGLLDLVNANTMGLTLGGLTDENSAPISSFNLDLYGKSTLGLQVNVMMFSFAFMGGFKVGYDGLFCDASSFKQNSLYADFVLEPYISVNLFRTVKIMVVYEADCPIFNINITTQGAAPVPTYKWNWFGDDVPQSIKVGVSLFL